MQIQTMHNLSLFFSSEDKLKVAVFLYVVVDQNLVTTFISPPPVLNMNNQKNP